ncbi:hypothetical protein CC117_12565 [Parafrankia colletiae]|uniref:Uncharacterized protein n=1 Tax=Parafrankia colletiae TaxID=573497 RepID=A0A1S1RAU1_9ACTN|nr:hypothetical protein [Parafrankia colletiae]MCK9900144.1 hypothetical protein [Frankia sp. Cpl3]OHV42382.1 hypothetical protein CC117_12565 [Parafrankia colletiae]
MVDLDEIPPGRFRVIQLATGERLDLADPTLGRPDGLELWDRAAAQTSRRHAPTARCLFPQCEGAPVILKTYRATGTRYASHFRGEGGRGDHTVAPPDRARHSALLDVWTRVYDHVGWQVAAHERGHGSRGRSPGLLIADAPQPTSTHVQLTQKKNHIKRTRDAAARGVTAVWNAGPGVILDDRVPELRFTTDIPEVLAARHPQDLTMLGIRRLTWVRDTGPGTGPGLRPQPRPRPMTMGDIAEQIPAGELAPVAYGKYRILLSRTDRAAYEAGQTTVDDGERPAAPPQGTARRHLELARRARTGRLTLIRYDPDEEATFAHGTGNLETLVPCVVCGNGTFRRRWGLAIERRCEHELR